MNLKKIFLVLLLFCFGFGVQKSEAVELLSIKNQCIALIASYGIQGDLSRLGRIINIALDAGMSENEIKEVIIEMYAYGGFPKSINATNTFIKIVNERKEKGLSSHRGKKPKMLPKNTDKYIFGGSLQNKFTGKATKDEFIEFIPVMDTFIKEHLYADIYSRGVLTDKEREVVAIGALSVMEGAEPQLQEHIQMAKNVGLSEETIEALIDLTNYAKGGIFGIGAKNKEFAQYFKGNSYLRALTREGVSVANITFEPKCRNNWHIHHNSGQILLVTYGKGYYQEAGKPVQKLKAGDVVSIPQGVKHWHGATADSWFSHVTIAIPSEGATTEWLEEVSDADYDKLANPDL